MSIVSVMSRSLLIIMGVTCLPAVLPVAAQSQQKDPLIRHLDAVYQHWRHAMVSRDIRKWEANTATHRRTAIVNRIHSERRPVGPSLFNLPVSPPDNRLLKLLGVKVKGVTAKMVYFGPVDFGVGGNPPDNLLVLSFAKEGSRWKYDTADYVNLASLPEARKQLKSGNLAHLEQPEFLPAGTVEQPSVVLRSPVKHIAKTYVYCPGREVRVMVNGISRHLYQNTKASEVIIGGAREGLNEVQFTVRSLPGGEGREPLAIRVYLMSQVEGVKPVKAFQYQVAENGSVRPSGTDNFMVGPAELLRLKGK